MTDESIQEPVVETPVVEVPKEFRYSYQPKDENGNNLGAPQVIIATSPEEALDKMAVQNSELVKLNRKLNRDIRVGNLFQDNISQDAPRVRPGQYEFNAQPLSAEERMAIVQDFADPENFDRAAQRIVKATIGDPEEIRDTLAQTQQTLAALYAERQAEAFVRAHPDYYPVPENSQTLLAWMEKNNLQPVKQNFDEAYKTLGPEGANVLAARPAPAAPVVPPVISAPAVETPAPQPRRPASSGLTRDQSSDTGPAPKKGYSQEEIDKMSSADYKKLVLDPEFRAKRVAQRA